MEDVGHSDFLIMSDFGDFNWHQRESTAFLDVSVYKTNMCENFTYYQGFGNIMTFPH